MRSKAQPLWHEGKACIIMKTKDGKHEESERIDMMKWHGVRENKENCNTTPFLDFKDPRLERGLL